jgi:hypothetical protein
MTTGAIGVPALHEKASANLSKFATLAARVEKQVPRDPRGPGIGRLNGDVISRRL